ncbi:lipopolysaccharide biosynthesis protein [Methyloceanibacter methanicus]|nr:hypothetical protein [Methyloceanibacter methanicus]
MRLAIIALILCGSYVGMHLNVATFFFVAAAAMGLSLLCQGWRVWQLVPDSVKNASAEFDVANWRLRSSRMWLSSLLDASGQYLEVIVIGIVLGPSTAAYYFSATRITNVFAMIAGAMTIYATRHISPLYHGRTTEELRDFLSSLAILSLLLGLGAFIVIMLGGKLLLSLFGPSYTDVYPALLILAVGGSLTAMAGPAPYLLLLTGHDGLYPWIVAGTLAVRIGLIVILGYWLGLIGAAIAGSLGAAATAVALVVACRWVLGVDPSVLAAVRRIPLGANRKDEGPREGA